MTDTARCLFGRAVSAMQRKSNPGRTQYEHSIFHVVFAVSKPCDNEEGQDLVEYALVVAIIALGATASMQSLAGAISTSFGSISTTFANAL